MTRSTTLYLIALTLIGYGLYTALYIPAMLVGPPVPSLLLGFTAQAVCAALAGLGILTGQRWARIAVLVLGASIAATNLWEGFMLGIIPFLRALLVAVLAIIGALFLAAYLSRPSEPA